MRISACLRILVALPALSAFSPQSFREVGARLLEQATKEARKVENRYTRVQSLCLAAKGWIPYDRARAQALIGEASAAAPMGTEEFIADAYVQLDPRLGIPRAPNSYYSTFYIAQYAKKNPAGAWAYVPPKESTKGEDWAHSVVYHLAHAAPQKALEFLAAAPARNVEDCYLSLGLTTRDPEVAYQCMKRVGKLDRHLVQHTIWLFPTSHAAEMERLARQETEPAMCYGGLARIAAHAQRKDLADEAAGWLATQPLSKACSWGFLPDLAEVDTPAVRDTLDWLASLAKPEPLTTENLKMEASIRLMRLADCWSRLDTSKALDLVLQAAAIDEKAFSRGHNLDDDGLGPVFRPVLARFIRTDPQAAIACFEAMRAHHRGWADDLLTNHLAGLAEKYPAQATAIARHFGSPWTEIVKLRTDLATIPSHPDQVPQLLLRLESDLSSYEFPAAGHRTLPALRDPLKAAALIPTLKTPAYRVLLTADLLPDLAKTNPQAAQQLLTQAIQDAQSASTPAEKVKLLVALSTTTAQI